MINHYEKKLSVKFADCQKAFNDTVWYRYCYGGIVSHDF